MAYFFTLSTEIIHMIVDYLPTTDDIFHLRQTCKHIAHYTTARISRDYFRDRIVMFERRSLETLVRIAKHPDFGPSIQSVTICTYHLLPLNELGKVKAPALPRWKQMEEMRHLSHSNRDIRSEDENEDADEEDTTQSHGGFQVHSTTVSHIQKPNHKAYRRYLQDQEDLIRTRSGLDYLTQAMEHLVSCKFISINDEYQPWGLEALQRDVGIAPQRCLTYQSSASVHAVRHIMHAMLRATTTSKIQVEQLEIDLGNCIDDANSISPDMLIMSPTIPVDQAGMLSCISKLHLTMNPTCPDSGAHSTVWISNLILFLDQFPRLSDLSLTFYFAIATAWTRGTSTPVTRIVD